MTARSSSILKDLRSLTQSKICPPTRNQIRLLDDFRIDSKYMNDTNTDNLSQVERIILKRCLPEDSQDFVKQILCREDQNQALEDLNIFVGNCYRFDPNNPRYDRDRASFPRVEDKWIAA